MHVHFCVNINNLTKKWYEGPNANALKMSLYVSYQKPKKLSAVNTLSLIHYNTIVTYQNFSGNVGTEKERV